MEKKETAIHKIGRKTLDTAIRHENRRLAAVLYHGHLSASPP